MSAIDLQGFSPDSFEQFTRALCVVVLGPGVTAFGNGPDGGREASFRGVVPYPHPPHNTWDGYGVIQAKFKEKVETTKRDQKWVEDQLKQELEQWRKSQKRSPKPDYYIFCTNVRLSSGVGGGRARAERILTEYQTLIKYKSAVIWDGNQVIAYVDTSSELRRRFCQFYTPGDLLAELAGMLRQQFTNADALLSTYLSREILADEDARLSQAGDRSEDRIRLANVFVDLPSSSAPSTEPPEDHGGDKLGSLDLLLRAAAAKLDPLALSDEREARRKEGRLHSRFLFLGGPGSGKSTIGQFLAQINRAALLARRPYHRLESKVRSVIDGIRTRCDEAKARWPTAPRYPFRVELNAFAKALAADGKEGVTSFSHYLRRCISRDVEVDHAVVREWLKSFPWLLILDGLDEVPSSSNRQEVITAIQSFLSEARDIEADLMVIASSRPDGYAGEFDGEEMLQRYLMPLSKARALACARRYVAAKASSKGEQRGLDAMRTLTAAIENPLIEKLMRSPLQVTFMVTVVAASGRPSESRWQLFNDYYRTIYERELHKAVRPFDAVLNERRQDIDALHHRIGFILQCRAESSGGTQADMSLKEFEFLVDNCLEENGLAGREARRQREMIIGAANQRLVFLTSRTPNRVSFEVRSLQEYMAAACLTNADSSEVVQRLEAIAHSAFWRNTLLFAVGRFFVEPQMRMHRDRIRVLCEDLNRNSVEGAETRLGSRVALDILESGTVGNVPLVIRNLATCALNLLAIPLREADDVVRRLAQAYDPLMASEFQEVISLRIGHREIAPSLGAWILTLHLEKQGVLWASKLASKNWPTEIADAATILAAWIRVLAIMREEPEVDLDRMDAIRLKAILPRIAPEEFSSRFPDVVVRASVSDAPWLSPLTSWIQFAREFTGESEVQLYVGGRASGVKIGFVPIIDKQLQTLRHIRTLGNVPNLHNGWRRLLSGYGAMFDPSAKTLANALSEIAESCDDGDLRRDYGSLSFWPLECCLGSARSVDEIKLFAVEASLGKLGDVENWKNLESSWKREGVSLEELTAGLLAGTPKLISSVRYASGSDSGDTNFTIARMLEMLDEASDISVRRQLSWMLTFLLRVTRAFVHLDPSQVERVLLPSRNLWRHDDILLTEPQAKTMSAEWITFFDTFGRFPNLELDESYWENEEVPLEWLLDTFEDDPTKVGLLRLAGFWCACGYRPAKPRPRLSSAGISGPDFRLARLLVWMAEPELSNDAAESIAKELPLAIDGDRSRIVLLLSALEHHARRERMLIAIIRALEALLSPDDWTIRGKLESLKNVVLQTRPSNLDDSALKKFKLPARVPMREVGSV